MMQEKSKRYKKMRFLKKKNKFQDYKNCLKATQIINTGNYLEKKRINVDSLKKEKGIHKK